MRSVTCGGKPMSKAVVGSYNTRGLRKEAAACDGKTTKAA